MRSKYLLAGAGIALVLTTTVVIGVTQQWWWLVAGAAMTLLSLTFLTALDADRRVRSLRPYIRGEVRHASARGRASKPATEAPPVSDIDVVGAVRVLQAQYTGRLDRMQESLDVAMRQLRARADAADGTPGPTVGPGDQA